MNTKYLNVSIVICCYNSAHRLPETIRHLLAQEIPEGLLWEVIVVDNACTDNTAQVKTRLRLMAESPEADILLLRRKHPCWTEAQRSLLPDGIRDTPADHILIEFKNTESLNRRVL